jgi:hypothetical protein
MRDRRPPINPQVTPGFETGPIGGVAEDSYAPQIEIVRFPVWLKPSAASEAFDFVNYVALPSVGTESVIISFKVPEGRNGIIKRFGNVYVGAGFTEGAGALQWQLLHNNVPIANYQNIPASLGATANPSEVASIRIKENELIQLVLNNLSLAVGGAFTGGRLGGWFYPVEEEPDGTWMG